MALSEIKEIPLESWFTAFGIFVSVFILVKIIFLISYSFKWAFVDMRYIYRLNINNGTSRFRVIPAVTLAFFVSAFEIAIERLSGRERTA